MPFTAHNILLGDGTQTKPDAKSVMSEHNWFRAAARLLRAIYPAGLSGVRIADLGCLEGGYTVEFARLGMEAVGIEVREANIANCRIVEGGVRLPNLTFIHDDVWNLDAHGTFDVIFCCGLLYHLDRPKAFIDLMARCCRKLLIINTHFASEAPNAIFDKHLSEVVENEGLRGRWFSESDDRKARIKGAWSSWDNARSFWLLRPDLLQAIRDAGFPVVLEQYDELTEPIAKSMQDGEYSNFLRSTFVGIKP